MSVPKNQKLKLLLLVCTSGFVCPKAFLARVHAVVTLLEIEYEKGFGAPGIEILQNDPQQCMGVTFCHFASFSTFCLMLRLWTFGLIIMSL